MSHAYSLLQVYILG